jgi:hypothetical protein
MRWPRSTHHFEQVSVVVQQAFRAPVHHAQQREQQHALGDSQGGGAGAADVEASLTHRRRRGSSNVVDAVADTDVEAEPLLPAQLDLPARSQVAQDVVEDRQQHLGLGGLLVQCDELLDAGLCWWRHPTSQATAASA